MLNPHETSGIVLHVLLLQQWGTSEKPENCTESRFHQTQIKPQTMSKDQYTQYQLQCTMQYQKRDCV